MGDKVSVLIRIPKELLDDLDKGAKERLYTRSGFIREAVDVLLRIPAKRHSELKQSAYKEGVRLSRKVSELVGA